MQKLKPNLESLPELVKSNVLSVQEALNFLSEDFNEKPHTYFINYRDEELISDITYNLLVSGESLFKRYKRENGSFTAYFKTYIKFQAKTVLRNNFRTENKQVLLQPFQQINYENQMNDYYEDEYSNRLPAFLKDFKAASPSSAYSASQKTCRIKDLFLTRKNKDKKMTIIVTLKESYYVTDKIIESVSRYCNISSDELNGNVEELRDELNQRKQKLAKIKTQRDGSYQLRRSLQAKLQSMDLSSEKAKNMYKRMMLHTNSWNKRNSLLADGLYKICPSNQRISEILGISERQVGYYIQNAFKLEKLLQSD